MTQTFEIVLNQAQNLTPVEREKLIELLKQMDRKKHSDKKREKIRAFRGKFSNILPSTKEFFTEKFDRKEI